MSDCGIYRITRKDTGQSYVGRSVAISRRLREHLLLLRNGAHPNARLLNAWRKYGENAFETEVVVECAADQLLQLEQFWIDCIGEYNIAKVAIHSRIGVRHSSEARQKLRAANQGKTISQEAREKISRAHKGCKRPPRGAEYRDRMSAAKRGTPVPVAARAKISAALKGRVFTPEHRAKIAEGVRIARARGGSA